MSIRFQFNTKELKGAIAALDAMAKKVPNDIAAGDSPMTLLKRDAGWSLVAARDYFTAEVKLAEVTLVGDNDGIIEDWDGTASIVEANTLGLINPTVLSALLSKLGASAKTILITIDNDRKKAKVDAGEGREYALDLGPSRKVMASFRTIAAATPVTVLPGDQFAWFCSAISTLSKVVRPSVAKPGFGCVCLNAFPSDSKTIQLSGNSDSDGYSVIYDTMMTSGCDFTALLPKNLSEAFSAFVSKLGNPEGDVSLSVSAGSDNKASSLVFTSELFSLSVACMRDDFPFKALSKITAMARDGYCQYDTTRDEIKRCIDRLALFSKTEDATTDIRILDGGTVEMVQHKGMMTRDKSARETMDAGKLASFPLELPDVGTVIKTSVLKDTVNMIPQALDTSLTICRPQGNSNSRLSLIANDGTADITIVLLGVKAM